MLFLDLGIVVLLMGIVLLLSRKVLFIRFRENGGGRAVDGRLGAMFIG